MNFEYIITFGLILDFLQFYITKIKYFVWKRVNNIPGVAETGDTFLNKAGFHVVARNHWIQIFFFYLSHSMPITTLIPDAVAANNFPQNPQKTIADQKRHNKTLLEAKREFKLFLKDLNTFQFRCS